MDGASAATVAASASLTTAATPISTRMSAVRAFGHSGLSGANVAPALKAASCESGSAAVRPRMRPTLTAVSSPTEVSLDEAIAAARRTAALRSAAW